MSEEASDTQRALESAGREYANGNLKAAEQICREIAPAQPDLAAQRGQLLGLILVRQGRMAEALEAYGEALRHLPDHPGIRFGLGYALNALGRHEEALPHLQDVAAAVPEYAEVHRTLGHVMLALGKIGSAIEYYATAARLDPNDAATHSRLGAALLGAGRNEEAAASLGRALALDPRDAETRCMLGNAHLAGKGLQEAAEQYQQAAALEPALAAAHLGLGRVRLRENRLEEAAACFERALALDGELAVARNNLGTVFRLRGMLDEAETAYRQLLAAQPGMVPACLNLGNVLSEQMRIEEAEALFRRCLADPVSGANAHYSLSRLLLLKGSYADGWTEYEWRWRIDEEASPPAFDQPQWRGENVEGKTVLLHAEQGLGDTLQFVRYAPLVAKRGARVILSCQEPLVRLMKSVEGVQQIVSSGAAVGSFDFHCPLMSLPLAFGTTLRTIPAQVPYLGAEPLHAAYWKRKIGEKPEGTLAVGLLWAGRSRSDRPGAYSMDRRRSLSLAQLAPLGDVRGVVFYSLQKGPAGDQAANPPGRMSLVDHAAELDDFNDTAGLVANLDLVISVDTSVAHLAGGMGKPVWILSRFDGCWRWLLDRDDSPWYPTARIFRQEKPGDWKAVVDRVAGELQETAQRAG